MKPFQQLVADFYQNNKTVVDAFAEELARRHSFLPQCTFENKVVISKNGLETSLMLWVEEKGFSPLLCFALGTLMAPAAHNATINDGNHSTDNNRLIDIGDCLIDIGGRQWKEHTSEVSRTVIELLTNAAKAAGAIPVITHTRG